MYRNCKNIPKVVYVLSEVNEILFHFFLCIQSITNLDLGISLMQINCCTKTDSTADRHVRIRGEGDVKWTILYSKT